MRPVPFEVVFALSSNSFGCKLMQSSKVAYSSKWIQDERETVIQTFTSIKAVTLNFFQQHSSLRRGGIEMCCTVQISYFPPEADESSVWNPTGALLEWAPGVFLK